MTMNEQFSLINLITHTATSLLIYKIPVDPVDRRCLTLLDSFTVVLLQSFFSLKTSLTGSDSGMQRDTN